MAIRLVVLTATAATLTLLAAPVLAQQAAPAPRMDNQQQRIDQGVSSGALTPHEAATDENHLRSDEALRARQLAHDPSGHLTAAQRRTDQRRLNRNSARIATTKHNAAIQ